MTVQNGKGSPSGEDEQNLKVHFSWCFSQLNSVSVIITLDTRRHVSDHADRVGMLLLGEERPSYLRIVQGHLTAQRWWLPWARPLTSHPLAPDQQTRFSHCYSTITTPPWPVDAWASQGIYCFSVVVIIIITLNWTVDQTKCFVV